MNDYIIQPNTPAEQSRITDAFYKGAKVECACIGNIINDTSDGGWIPVVVGNLFFHSLRYRIASSLPSPGPVLSTSQFSARELLAIMSATLFDNYSGPNTPAKVVLIAKQILHEIDNTTR